MALSRTQIGEGTGQPARRRRPWIACALLVMLLAGCAGGGTPVPAQPTTVAAVETPVQPGPEPTSEPTATDLPAATATRTPRATTTPRPTPTATATRRPTSVPTGPTATDVTFGNASKLAQVGLKGEVVPTLVVGGKDRSVLFYGWKGVLRSDNGGKTWRAALSVAQAPIVTSLAIAPSDPLVMYVGASDGCDKTTKRPGYASEDGGETWRQIGNSLLSIAVDPKNPRLIYAVDCEGLKQSTNGGTSWTALDGAQLTGGVRAAIAIAPDETQTVYLATTIGASKMVIIRSVDHGATWQGITPQIDSGVQAGRSLPATPGNTSAAQPLALALDQKNPKFVLVSTSYGVFRSEDSGATWTLLDGGLENTAVQAQSGSTTTSASARLNTALLADPEKSGAFWVGTGTDKLKGVGLYRTRDSGENWRKAITGLEGKRVYALALVGTGSQRILYVATDDGLWSVTAP